MEMVDLTGKITTTTLLLQMVTTMGIIVKVGGKQQVVILVVVVVTVAEVMVMVTIICMVCPECSAMAAVAEEVTTPLATRTAKAVKGQTVAVVLLVMTGGTVVLEVITLAKHTIDGVRKILAVVVQAVIITKTNRAVLVQTALLLSHIRFKEIYNGTV